MSSIVSRYAVPFVDRKSSVIGNVLTKTLVGESGSDLTGKLVLVLPTLQSENNSVGFRLTITDSSDDLVFVGNVSGNSSDGYSWLNVSSSQTKGLSRYGLPTLFCESKVSAKYNDEGVLVSPEYILKSIQFGDDSTDWGPKLTITIEYLSATLLTALDNDDDNDPDNVSTSTVANFLNNWSISVGSNLSWDTVATVDQLTRDTGISLNGVVTGTESDGVITTSFTQPWFNELFNNKDGSQIDLSKNTSVQISESANKLSGNIILKNDDSTQEVYFNQTSPTGVVTNGLSFDRPGTYNFTTRINQVSLGDWIDTNTRYISQKVLQNTSSPVNNPLKLGELGLVANSINSDLYVGVNYLGTGLQPMLVGGVKICDTEDDFNNLAVVYGRLAFYNSKLYIGYKPTTGDARWLEVPTGGGEGGSSSVTMDSIINGPLHYMKTNSEAVDSSGYVKMIGTTGSSSMDSSKVIDHVLDAEKLNPTYHISESDRQKLNNLPATGDEYVTKSEFNTELSKKSGINFTGYHDPVSGIVDNYDSLPSGTQVSGTRILIKSPRRSVYTYSSTSGSWENKNDEVLIDGSVVMNTSDYNQYYVRGEEVVNLSGASGFVTLSELNTRLDDYIKNSGSTTLKGDWSVVSSTGVPVLSLSSNSLSLGSISKVLTNISLNSTNVPTWNGYDIITEDTIGSYISEEILSMSTYHRPVNSISLTDPDTNSMSEKTRILVQGKYILEKSGSTVITETISANDEVYNLEDNSIYTIDERLNAYRSLYQIETADSGGLKIENTDGSNKITHSNSVTPQLSTSLLKMSFDAQGHITGTSQVTSEDLPDIPAEKITGDVSDIVGEITKSDASSDADSEEEEHPELKGWYTSSPGIASLGEGMDLEVDHMTEKEVDEETGQVVTTTYDKFSSRLVVRDIPTQVSESGVLSEFMNNQKITEYECVVTEETSEEGDTKYRSEVVPKYVTKDRYSFKPVSVKGSVLISEGADNSMIKSDEVYDLLVMGSDGTHGVTATATSKSTGSMYILLADSGSTTWRSTMSAGGEVYYTNSEATTVEVGGIPVGSTFNNVSMSDMWTKLLYKFKIATISLTGSTPGGVKEVGTTITSTFTANVVTNNSVMSKLEIVGPSGTIISTTDPDETSLTSAEQSITSSSASTITYRGIATVTNDYSKTATTDITSSVSYQFVFPYYIGSVTTPTPSVSQITGLTKEVKAAGNVTHSFTYTSSYVCMAVPAEWVISDIKDASTGLSLMNGFNKSSMTITANGIGHEYSVYVTKEASDADNYTIQFVKG
jgi:hypothetical protein